MKTSLHGYFPDELAALCKAAGEAEFRGAQVWQWLQNRHALEWAAMSNLPRRLKDALDADYTPAAVKVVRTSGTGGTQKQLLELADGETIESVWIPVRDRATVCVSTQVGCKMGCAFCASGQGGFVRDLSAGEIVAQVQQWAALHGGRPDNVVFMGMGEPLDNYDAVLKAVRILNHPDGLNIGARKITLSTSGIIPGMERLADEGLQLELSVSLHAAAPDIRRRLMPIENKYGMDELLAACAAYTRKTKRIITFEYTLVDGVNDDAAAAAELAARLRKFPCRVNLIPLSPVAEFIGAPPPRQHMEEFLRILNRAGVEGTIRESKGKQVDAACGQLRRRTAATEQRNDAGSMQK